MLDYWDGFASDGIIEEPQVLRAIEPKFNRLVVFDPRIPHGVRRVEGTSDPRYGRLVVHGWFVQPRPFVEGPLQPRLVASRIDDLTAVIRPHLEAGLDLTGLLSLGINVAASGAVTKVAVLSDNTRTPRTHLRQRKLLAAAIVKAITRWDFPKRASRSQITLPLVFAA